MNYKKNKIISIIKICKRNINTTVLKDLLGNLAIDKNYYKIKGKINNDSLINHYNKLNEKTLEIDKKEIDYSNIENNLKESERLLNIVQDKFDKVNGINKKIDIEIREVKIESDKINIDVLNNQNKNNQIIIENNTKDNIIFKNELENIEDKMKISENAKKSIFDIEWLQPFLDFMHNHSTLVLTLGSGLVMGVMWYMNNIGVINVGSLLTRLGIQIFSGNSAQNSGPITMPGSLNSGIITIPSVSNSGNTVNSEEISRGFFRQLGEKVLKLIDALIVKLESKQQKYK